MTFCAFQFIFPTAYRNTREMKVRSPERTTGTLILERGLSPTSRSKLRGPTGSHHEDTAGAVPAYISKPQETGVPNQWTLEVVLSRAPEKISTIAFRNHYVSTVTIEAKVPAQQSWHLLLRPRVLSWTHRAPDSARRLTACYPTNGRQITV